MKKLLILLLVFFSSVSFAKKIKFSVDMDTITPNVNGIHIAGDFQDEAGYPDDWNPATTLLTKESPSSTIYSIVLDIPAFHKYEFKFVNGIFDYEMEFVPVESRVLYNFLDNRWVYLDSLSNDTQIVKPVIYSSNAPAGKHLLRFRVDMQYVSSVSPLGVHVAGNFQGWNPTTNYMYSFTGKMYEYITYVDTGNSTFEHQYMYYNGEANSDKETVPVACANINGNRKVFISKDSILSIVCFSQCSPCSLSSMNEVSMMDLPSIYPNPSNGSFVISNLRSYNNSINIYDVVGNLVYTAPVKNQQEVLYLNLPKGLYFLRTQNGLAATSSKLMIE